MEILGRENQTENMTIDVKSLIVRITASDTMQQNDVNDCIVVLCYALDKLTQPNDDITALSMVLNSIPSLANVPILDNLVQEYRLRFIRTTMFSSDYKSNCNPLCATDTTSKEEPKEKERFVPTATDNFELPAPGNFGNLTVTAPDRITGKTLIRELIIDSDGYVVKEVSRRYTDINTDESEQIFTEAYLNQLNKIKNS